MAFAHAQLDGRPKVRAVPRMVVRSDRARQIAAELEAAWRADDAGYPDAGYSLAAREHRLAAAWHLRLALRDGEEVTGQRGCDLALLADLLRRAGDFGGALTAVEHGLECGRDHPVQALLHFQHRLARARDAGEHDLGEAFAMPS